MGAPFSTYTGQANVVSCRSMTDRPLFVKFVINNDKLIKPEPCKVKQNASFNI